MITDKVTRSITCYVPGTMCNLRCSYCYISNCVDENHLIKPSYDYPLETMIQAFSPSRMGGGIAEIGVISGGETLIDDTVVPFVHGLLKQGHVVSVITNLTLNERIDQLLDIDEKYLKRLIVKGSLHYLELKRLNKLDDFFNNMKKVLNKGASGYPFIAISKDYMPYIDEIEAICMEKIGVMPHCTPCMLFEDKNDIKRNGKVQTDPECTQDFIKYIDNKFNSKIFDIAVRFIDIPVKDIFCYAGEWSFCVSLKDGAMFKCHNCKPEANFFENLDKMPKLLPIGNNCQVASCALQYNFIANGLIPEVCDIPTLSQMLERPELFNQEVRQLLDVKFTDFYKQYNDKEKEKINKSVYKFFKYGKLKLKYKILLFLYEKIKAKLERKRII